jgi:hypothetical protein
MLRSSTIILPRWICLGLFGLAAILCGSVHAQTPPDKFAGQIKTYTDAATLEKDLLSQMLGVAQDISEFSKEDVKLITAYMEEATIAWSNAAAALQKGDEAGAAAFVKRAQELDSKRDVWNQRLAWRRGQAQREYLPANEEIFNLLVGDRTAGETREIEAFIEAKKQRSEAYGRLADAATPAAEPQALARLQDEVYALDVEVQVADMKRVWANEDRGVRQYVMTDASVSSPALTAAKQRLAEWRQKYEETYRQWREREHALEQQKRQSAEVLEARNLAYRAAKAARDGAVRNGK